MLRMNRYFNGGGVAGHTQFGGSGARGNTLPWFGNFCVLPDGFGQVFSAVPDGYGLDNGLYPPLTEGAMASFDPDAMKFTGGDASMVKAQAIAGEGAMALTGNDANMGAIATLEGEGQMALTGGSANLQGVAFLEGEGEMSLTGDGNLGAVAPMEGEGSMSLSGTGSIRGTVSMAGEFRNSDTEVTVAYDGAIYVSEWGVDNLTFPSGTATKPVLTLATARALCVKYGLRTIYLNGTHTMSDDYDGYELFGWGPLAQCVIILSPSYTVVKTKFIDLTVMGTLVTIFPDPPAFSAHLGTVQFEGCYIYAVNDLAGNLLHSQLSGAITIKAGKWISAGETVIEGDTCTIDLQSASGTTVSMDMSSGWAQFENCAEGTLVELNVKGGEVSFLASCTGGEYYLEGVGTLFMEGTGMVKKENHFVWDEDASYVNTPDSTGSKLNAAGAAGDPWATPQGQSVVNNTGLVPATL